MNTQEISKSKKGITTRAIVMTGILSAVATILMFIDFSVPFMPAFIKLDISELPALVASFSLGPVYGGAVCLIKNLINLLRTTTGGVGEFCNFLLGICFVVPAGIIYKFHKSKKGALIGSLSGSALMAVLSVPINYYITYPVYTNFMPIEAIIDAYKAINPAVDGLLQCLLIFNLPFTFMKGIIVSAIVFLIYKKISPLIKAPLKQNNT